ncbi:MAG TPA: DedA family protein [Cytophagales bacterium]|nr:DedA family protein [Cytophagales bacterium]
MHEIIQWGGIAIIIIFVYIETGFLVGLIVPGGETLLFSAGLLTAVQTLNFPLWLLIPLLIIAGFSGDCTGYWLGKKLGSRLHKKKDTLLFKRKHLEKAEDFYRKHKKTALIIGRFLPIIRTFNPLISGSSKMDLKQFIPYTAIGTLLYITTLVLAGYLLGSIFPSLGSYVEYIFLGVAVTVIIVMIYNLRKTVG